MEIRHLGDWLLNHFHERGRRLDGMRRQWSDLKGKKTMIVLDDVDSENQLSLLPALDHFGKGSCIVLTSREIDIFKFYDDYELYQVHFLNDDDAKKLFCQHAFGSQDIPSYSSDRKHLREPVEEVVKKCNGLPLTLEVMGRYLKNKVDANVWKETIDKLTRAESIDGKQKDRVWASLSVSYEALVKEEQEMFIEAGTYFFGQPLDEALAAWSSISAHSKSRWENLVSRSMVQEHYEVVRWKYQKTVWVHEHLRDLSWSMTKNDTIVLGSNANADESVNQLNSKQVNSKTRMLQLDCDNLERTLQLERVADLKELKYLDLDKVSTEGSCKNLARTLILLKWNLREGLRSQLPMTLIPMTSLAVLELGDWDVPRGFPEALGKLTNLRRLSLSYLRGLDHLPDNFGNLLHLIYLNLEYLSLRSLPKSFGNLSALKHLNLEKLNVCELPDSFGNLSSLVDLRIYSCEKLASLPSSFAHHLTSLNKLTISWCPLLECLPDSLSGLSSLRKLDLCRCDGLKELGDSFGSLGALEDLHLGWTRVERLPQSFSQLSRLQRLHLGGCESLKELGDSFANLSALKYLYLDDTSIGGLPESFGRLSSLEKLKCKFDQARLLPDNFCLLTALRDLSIESASLESLPESLGELARLENLRLEINNVNALPPSLGTLASLRYLDIRSEKLEKLPDSFGNLSSLTELTVKAEKLEKLPDSFGNLSSLTELTVRAEKLEKLPDSFGNLSSLTELTVGARTSVGILNSLGPLLSLQSIDVFEFEKSGEHKQDCDDSVEKLAESFGKLSSLETLKFQGKGLESLPNSVGELSSLKNMDIDCGDLKELPESLVMLSSLETLKIVGRKLERLPQGIGRLHSLRTMELEVSSIRFLPESINQLSSLRKFSFNCDGHDRMPDHFELLASPSLSLELKGSASVPEGIGKLCSLQDLTLKFDSVKSSPEGLGELSSLQKLEISCPRYESLPDSLGRLSSLKQLSLSRCFNLTSVPDSLSRLSSLRELSLSGCHDLTSLPDSLGHLSSLRELSLSWCWTLTSLPDSLGRPSSSHGELPQGTISSNAESVSQTTTAGPNAFELTVSVQYCPQLQELTMRRLGWVAYKEDRKSWVHYRRKRSDNVPLGRVEQSTRVLCYKVLRKLYSAFQCK